MVRFLSHSLAMVAFLVSITGLSLRAESPAKPAKNDPLPQDVFAAIAAGDLEVGVVPRDERRLTIQMKNKTDRPLTIQMPPALAAAPILAQQPFPFPGGGFPNPNANRNQQAPQQLGLPGGQGNNGGNLFGGNRGGIFNIPAGRAIKIKADCVCLEYGKPEPDTRMKYELKPLASVCDKPELVAVLQSLGSEQINQRVAQAAAWHLTNDLSWDQLANLIQRQVGGVKEMQFQTSEVAAAKSYLQRLPAQQQPKQTNERSPGESAQQPASGFGGFSISVYASASAVAGPNGVQAEARVQLP
jgi:hypothetical protein